MTQKARGEKKWTHITKYKKEKVLILLLILTTILILEKENTAKCS